MNRKEIQRKLGEEQKVPGGQFNRIYDEYCDKFDLAGYYVSSITK